ncbi:hypothetical protein BDY24DRAFT_416012 [Mrakia frigida]|uniref:uncharacterized protein n=1 Tax=Mrakia frigida TaxID=29902 RepID=UPI003FCC224C
MNAPLPALPSVHTLIASRSRHSPLDEKPTPPSFDSPHQTPFSPSSQSTTESSWQSDPTLPPSTRMSPSSQATPSLGEGRGAQAYRIAAGSIQGSYDDDAEDDLGFTGRSRERERSNAATLTPSFQDNTAYSPHQAFLSFQRHSLSPSERSPNSPSFDDNITLSGTESPRSSIDVDNNRDFGPKLRFGEAAPWELDSPSSSSHHDGSGGPPRRPSLPTSPEADQPTMSTSSSGMSFSRGGAAAAGALGVANGFRTRSKSATQTAAGVFRGLGGLVGRKKSKDADAEESWAALGLGIQSADQGALRRKISSETVMLGADLFGAGGERDLREGAGGGGEVARKRSFDSLIIGRSSPIPSRAASTYSIYSNQDAIQYPNSNSSSPNRPLPPPLPSQNISRPDSPAATDCPYLGFINNTQHHGLISLGEAQARQKNKLDRMASPSPSRRDEQLPSPLPSPAVASNARGRLRTLASSSTIKQSNSEASVLSTDSVFLTEVDADQQQKTPLRPRRVSAAKLPSTGSMADGNAFEAPSLPTPPKSSLRNKKSAGGVGGLLKMFGNKSPSHSSSSTAPTSFVPPPLPSSSTTRPSVSSTLGLSLPNPSTNHSRRPSGSLSPAPTGSVFSKATDEFSSSVSNPFRTKPSLPNLSIPASNSSSSAEDSPAISPFPNLKLFTAGLPQSYLSSPPPPTPSLAPTSPYFEAGSLLSLRPPPSPSASSFTTAHSSSSNQFSSSGSTVESASLLSPTSAGGFAMSTGFGSGSGRGSGSGSGREEGGYSEEEKDLVIKRLEEMVINERKVWRIKEAEYESQIRELTHALHPPPATKIVVFRSSTSTNDHNPPVSPTSSSVFDHASCTSCGSHLSTKTTPSASTVALRIPGDHLASTSILNRGKPKTGGARGVFGSGSLRE